MKFIIGLFQFILGTAIIGFLFGGIGIFFMLILFAIIGIAALANKKEEKK